MRGVIDDTTFNMVSECGPQSQSAFVRGVSDDKLPVHSMLAIRRSQSAFVRGFIDDVMRVVGRMTETLVSIRVRARRHR